jgi:hypothetical protein
MTTKDFEELLTAVSNKLTSEIRANATNHVPSKFEARVRAVLPELAKDKGLKVDLSPHPHIFPDIVLGEFGIEVKVTNKDSWRSVANSVFEGTRDAGVKHVYVLFGKMGGTPEVKWGRYENCVMHVRTSHVPRFEVEINPEKTLFAKIGISYQDFCSLSPHEKMEHIRRYARGRLKKGDRLWWLEDTPEREQEHSLPLEVRLYMNLEQDEKRKLRAEAALLCPQIVKPSRSKKKYDDVAIYLLTYHGVLCSQVRDLFSAGSVALRSDGTRGGNYTLRALKDIETEMKLAAEKLEDALFVEYWERSVPPPARIKEWLKRADGFAKGWRPSKVLFRNSEGKKKRY